MESSHTSVTHLIDSQELIEQHAIAQDIVDTPDHRDHTLHQPLAPHPVHQDATSDFDLTPQQQLEQLILFQICQDNRERTLLGTRSRDQASDTDSEASSSDEQQGPRKAPRTTHATSPHHSQSYAPDHQVTPVTPVTAPPETLDTTVEQMSGHSVPNALDLSTHTHHAVPRYVHGDHNTTALVSSGTQKVKQ